MEPVSRTLIQFAIAHSTSIMAGGWYLLVNAVKAFPPEGQPIVWRVWFPEFLRGIVQIGPPKLKIMQVAAPAPQPQTQPQTVPASQPVPANSLTHLITPSQIPTTQPIKVDPEVIS